MEDMALETAMLVDKVSTAALMCVAVVALWRLFRATNERLIACLTGQTAELGAKLEALRAAVDVGLAGLRGTVDDHARLIAEHARRIDQHGRTLDRHAAIIDVMHEAGRSGVYTRTRLAPGAAEEEIRQ